MARRLIHGMIRRLSTTLCSSSWMYCERLEVGLLGVFIPDISHGQNWHTGVCVISHKRPEPRLHATLICLGLTGQGFTVHSKFGRGHEKAFGIMFSGKFLDFWWIFDLKINLEFSLFRPFSSWKSFLKLQKNCFCWLIRVDCAHSFCRTKL